MGPEVPASADLGGGPEDREPEERLVRSTAVMAVGTTLSRVTGFLRIAAMAYALGVAESRLPDAYNVANNLPNIVYELVLGGVLTSVLVPVFVERLTERGREDAWDAGHAIMTVAFVLLGALTVLGILAAPWIVKLYTFRVPGAARGQAQEVATFFLRFFIPQIALYGIGAVATGLLNAHRRFAAPMFAPILNNLVVIASFLVFAAMPLPDPSRPPSTLNVSLAQKLVLAIGTTAGVAAMTFALWPSLRRTGFRTRWRLAWRHEAVRKLLRLSGWVVAYVALNQVGLLVVIVLAGEVEGGYTAYQAAFIFFQLPYAIFSVSIMTALLPRLSENWARGDRTAFRSSLARGIRASAFVVLPAAAGYVVLARPIVRLLLEHGVATTASTDLVAGVLVFFALGLFSFSAFLLFLRAFYAMQDTRTPTLINVGAVAVNIVVDIALFPVLEVRGLALGHAVAYTFAAAVAAVTLARRLGGLEGSEVMRGIAKVLVSAVATAAAAYGLAQLSASTLGVETLAEQLVQVGGAVAGGVAVFLLAAVVLRIDELRLLRGALVGRFRR